MTTLLYSLNSALKLLITEGIIEQYMSTITFTYIISWVYNFINALHLMPIMVLACDMCPTGIEATFYSFVLALTNVGYLLSYDFGGILTFRLGITSRNFDNLSFLIIIASLFPLTSLPLLFCLVPSQEEFLKQLELFRNKHKDD